MFPQKLCSILNPWYRWMWLFLEIGSLQMRSRSNEVMLDYNGPSSSDWCPSKTRGISIQTHRGKKAMGRQRQSLEWHVYKPRTTKGCWKAPEARSEASVGSCLGPPERASSVNTWFQTSRLQNSERMNTFPLSKAARFVALCYGSQSNMAPLSAPLSGFTVVTFSLETTALTVRDICCPFIYIPCSPPVS